MLRFTGKMHATHGEVDVGWIWSMGERSIVGEGGRAEAPDTFPHDSPATLNSGQHKRVKRNTARLEPQSGK